jgi:hypothetical protein
MDRQRVAMWFTLNARLGARDMQRATEQDELEDRTIAQLDSRGCGLRPEWPSRVQRASYRRRRLCGVTAPDDRAGARADHQL